MLNILLLSVIELENEVIDVKDMSTGETETINLNNLVNYFQEKIINKRRI